MLYPYLFIIIILITVTLQQNLWEFETPNGDKCFLKRGSKTDDDAIRYEFGRNNMVIAQDWAFDDANNYTIAPLLSDFDSDRCAEECHLNPLCWHFVWSSSDKICRLKEKVPESVKAIKKLGFSSGSRTRKPQWQPTDVGAWWSNNCHFEPVEEFHTWHALDKSVRIRCVDLCVQDPQCNHFSYNDGYCKLKNLTDPAILPSKGKAGDICGRFRMENAGGEIVFYE